MPRPRTQHGWEIVQQRQSMLDAWEDLDPARFSVLLTTLRLPQRDRHRKANDSL